MDEQVHQQLLKLQLPYVTPIPLSTFENDALLSVKPGRSRAEYCWTITPFTPELVFSRDAAINRVTYIDADLLFFNDPSILFREFEQSGKHVMITEHAYAPEYSNYLENSGRFCVQFMVFDRTPQAQVILAWWKARCLEWCFARLEDGKFGDQKYLDVWPQMFADDVHILKQVEQTLAPWNVDYLLNLQPKGFRPVLFHFHSFRIIASDCARLYEGYRISASSRYLYDEYIAFLQEQIDQLRQHGIPLPLLPESADMRAKLRSWITLFRGYSARAGI